MNKKSLLTFVLLLVAALTFARKPAGGDAPRYSILGDSYSTYEGCLTPDTNSIWYYRPESTQLHRGNDVRLVEQTWWHQVIRRMGGVLERNNSYSGATVCCTGYRGDDYSDRAFITRSNKLGEPDVILVCGGTNDSWANAPIGEYVYGNWSRQELYAFRPAMAKLLHDLRANYPTARIVFILNSELKPSINESVHTVCRHYGVPCLDLRDIDKQQGHPSVKGMAAFADQVVDFLNSSKR